jgi:hypothetical protein
MVLRRGLPGMSCSSFGRQRSGCGARSRTRTWGCRCVGPMPWPLGEASECWCTREDLNLHALAAAASEVRLPFRHECMMVLQWLIERRFPPYQSGALPPDDCGRLRWCWLEDSNLPPLAYKASALPDELSQLLKIDKRIAAPLQVWKRTCLNGPEVRRRVQFWTFTMSKSAAPTAP